MSNDSNSRKFSIRRKIRNIKRLIYQGFQSLKECIFLHKIGILRELAFLSILALIAVIFLQFLYISGLKNDYANLNNAYIDKQSLLEKTDVEIGVLIKDNNKLKEEITEQRKIINEKDEFLKAIKKELNITKEKLTSNQQSVSRGGGDLNNNYNNNEWMKFQMTHYTAFCPTGCTGITATGVDVSNTIYHKGKRVVAVDPKVIPLNSIVQIKKSDGTVIEAIASDTGGKIKGNIIDLLVTNKIVAKEKGRQNVEVRIIR